MTPQVLELELDLLLDRQDAVGQQAAQPERVALVLGKARSLVSSRLPSRAGPASAIGAGPAGRDVVVRGGQRTHAPRG